MKLSRYRMALAPILLWAAWSCSVGPWPYDAADLHGPVPPALPYRDPPVQEVSTQEVARQSASTQEASMQEVSTQEVSTRSAGAGGDTAAATQPAADGPLSLRATFSHAAYTRSAPPQLLLKLDYRAAWAAPAQRPPLNLALVLDRSASMAAGGKLPYTLEAARWVIDNLTDRDVLSIVAFNHEVTVLAGAGRVVNKPFLYHRLEEVEPEGTTDLSAGLLEGIAQVSSRSAEGQVRQVLLLTDGLANKGVTDSAALSRIVERAAARGVGVSTFGCGTEFNEKLLTAMAAAGSGRYTYIRSPEAIPDAFKDELRGLVQVVAQNVALEVSVVGGRVAKVYGQSLPQPAPTSKLTLGNLRAGERGMVLVRLEPSDLRDGSAIEASARLTFDDPQSARRVERRAAARATFRAGASGLGEDRGVVLYGALFDALELAEEGVRGLDTERCRRARQAFDRWYEEARRRALQDRDQDLLNRAFMLKHFIQELAAAEQEGWLHDHAEARARLQKDVQYQRYLLDHHRP